MEQVQSNSQSSSKSKHDNNTCKSLYSVISSSKKKVIWEEWAELYAKKKVDLRTNYDIDRQCRDAKGNGYQHIQKETANEDRECQPKWTKTVLLQCSLDAKKIKGIEYCVLLK